MGDPVGIVILGEPNLALAAWPDEGNHRVQRDEHGHTVTRHRCHTGCGPWNHVADDPFGFQAATDGVSPKLEGGHHALGHAAHA